MAQEAQLGSPDFRAYMHSPLNRFDPDTHMYKEIAHEPDISKLRFLRWLGEQGRLEHGIESLPKGEYSDRYVIPVGSARFRLPM